MDELTILSKTQHQELKSASAILGSIVSNYAKHMEKFKDLDD